MKVASQTYGWNGRAVVDQKAAVFPHARDLILTYHGMLPNMSSIGLRTPPPRGFVARVWTISRTGLEPRALFGFTLRCTPVYLCAVAAVGLWEIIARSNTERHGWLAV